MTLTPKRANIQIPAALIPAATRNVLAHLIALSELGAVAPVGPIAANTVFSAT